MERKKNLVLACLLLFTVGGTVISLSIRSYARGRALVAQAAKNGSVVQKRLGIQISLSKSFTVPAAKPGRILETFLRLPAQTAGESPAAFSAIKLAPRMLGDKLEVDVSVLAGDIGVVKSCKDWELLKESPIMSYTLSEGEEVTVSRLSHLGSNFKNGTLTFKVVSFDELELVGDDCGCGRCDDLYCCPNRGSCIGCGTCGDVCCRIKT